MPELRNSKLVGWIALGVLITAVVVLLSGVLFSDILSEGGLTAEFAMWAAGGLAAVSVVLGLISFRSPAGKVATIGGLALVALVLLIAPVRSGLT